MTSSPQPTGELVFTGEWLSTFADGCACHEFREGYTGTLAGYWNGWAVFTVTADVMRAIVANHQHLALSLIGERTHRGEHVEDAWIHVQTDLAAIYWLGRPRRHRQPIHQPRPGKRRDHRTRSHRTVQGRLLLDLGARRSPPRPHHPQRTDTRPEHQGQQMKPSVTVSCHIGGNSAAVV
jgi:hypothetical protein